MNIEHQLADTEPERVPDSVRRLLEGQPCDYCGLYLEGAMQVDHVIPRSRGGPSTIDNLVAACRWCNTDKLDFTPEEWKAWRLEEGLPWPPQRWTDWLVETVKDTVDRYRSELGLPPP